VDHAVLTPGGWRKAGELAAGDAVLAADTADTAGPGHRLPPGLEQGIGVWTARQRERLIGESGTCHLCGRTLPGDRLALDHVVPVHEALGRALDESNPAPACEPCHSAKSAREQARARRGDTAAAADPVVSVADDGEEMTYDLSVTGPWHNFL